MSDKNSASTDRRSERKQIEQRSAFINVDNLFVRIGSTVLYMHMY